MAETNKNPRPARRRARKPDGKFQGNDPTTPQNEAWEPIEVSPGLPKEKYAPTAKVTGTSNDTAGKYSKKPKVNRPGIGKAHTKYN